MPWSSDVQSEVVLLVVLLLPPSVVEPTGASTTEVVLDESDEVVLEPSLVEPIGPSTIEVVLAELLESLELAELLLELSAVVLLSVLVVLLEVPEVPGSGEGEAEAPTDPEIVASVGDAWRTAPVPPARAQTEMAKPTAARDEIAARRRDGVGMENPP